MPPKDFIIQMGERDTGLPTVPRGRTKILSAMQLQKKGGGEEAGVENSIVPFLVFRMTSIGSPIWEICLLIN